MALIKSISGIRGTIGGFPSEGLSALDIVKFTSAYAQFLLNRKVNKKIVVVGRDARISGSMVRDIVCGSLVSMGFNVIDLGLSTTPTTELAVIREKADGGIIITASHNPMEWNALKLLNADGEFLNDSEGKEVLRIAEQGEFRYSEVQALGKVEYNDSYIRKHIEEVIALPLVDCKSIADAGFTVAVDAVNSTGGIAIPQLLRALGVSNIIELNCVPDGKFAHTPEPLPENLYQISELMKKGGIDVGFVVDPDVDRLAIVMENGEMFIEENTLVAVADYVLSVNPGNTVSNLSSSRALADITNKYGASYAASAVGEVNVVDLMKQTNAVIGGEGNGGVIYPELHYGRDALVGIALFLSYLAKKKISVSKIKSELPEYTIVKSKITLTPETDVDSILTAIKDKYSNYKLTDIDGVKIDFEEGWVHLRKSNTEPIIRIYAEAKSRELAENLADEIKKLAKNIVKF